MTRPRECWELGGRLAREWREKHAVRVGEAAVVSRQLHTISPLEPDTVRVLTNADAGQVFYKRVHPGEVVHLDLFHDIMAIPPREIADWLTSSVMAYQTDWTVISGSNELPVSLVRILDMIDIQTGSGGGRLTGKLHFGQRQSICQAHMNHIHLTILLPDRFASLVFYLVNSLEQYLLARGVEIRRINHLVEDETPAGYQHGVNDYSAHTDSLLLEYQNQAPYSNMHSGIPGLSMDDERPQKDSELGPFNRASTHNARIHPDGEMTHESSYVARLCNPEIAEAGGVLSGREGRLLRDKLRYGFIKSLRSSVNHGSQYMGPLTLGQATGKKRSLDSVAYHPGDQLGELALVETITNNLMRQLQQNSGREIKSSDLRLRRSKTHMPCNICLLIDASASMKGKRLQAATALAKHLVAATRDKVAVLTFQESEVRLAVPFTRKLHELNAGLELIKPYGLTPLATGLAYARDYLRQSKVRNPLLVLISDGIPTVPSSTTDPIGDAINEARSLSRVNVHFCCIGLEPNQNVLAEVTASAKGTLHIVKELDGSTLVQIVSRVKETI